MICRFTFTAVFLFILALPAHAATNCDDVRKVDFSNLSFTASTRNFDFHNGKALLYTEPEDGLPVKVDWAAKIEKDFILEPAPDIVTRFLLIHDDHEFGSGWNYYLVGFACRNSQLQQVFEQDKMSLAIETAVANKLTISFFTKDASRQKRTYLWNPSAYRYEWQRQ